MAIGMTGTEAAFGGGHGRRGGRTPATVFAFLLAVSVAANAFFLVGYFRAASLADDAATPAGAAEIVADRLGLDAAQRALFDRLRAETRDDAERAGRDVQAARDAFWAEMAKADADDGVLQRHLDAAADENFDLNLAVVARLRTFLDALSPAQKRMFIETVRERPIVRGRFLMTGR